MTMKFHIHSKGEAKGVDVADLSSKGSTEPTAGASYNRYPILAASKTYGDGTFFGSDGEKYSVDASLIGAAPEAVIEGMGIPQSELGPYGSWVEVSHTATLEFDNNGT